MIMLIAATVMPVVFDTLTDVPDGTSQAAALVAALATMVTVVAPGSARSAGVAAVVAGHWHSRGLRSVGPIWAVRRFSRYSMPLGWACPSTRGRDST